MNEHHLYGVKIMSDKEVAAKIQLHTSEQPLSFDERMELECKARGVTSILYQPPSGNCWLFVSKGEQDLKTAFLKALIDTMIVRGSVGTDGPVTIRRLTAGLVVPGKEVFWSVSGADGQVFASGYCANEKIAQQLIADAILSGK